MVNHPRHPNPRPAPRQETPKPKTQDVAGGEPERVAKALARAGVASRRDVEKLIEEGRVALNGKVLTSPAIKVAPGDILTVDGAVVEAAEPTRLWRYHKPVGLVTTHKDPQNRPTVFEQMPEGMPRVISVGRLDLNSEGLLLLTNDGELARALELPSSGWVRTYRARAYGQTTPEKLAALANGVTVEGVSYGPIQARLDKAKSVSGEKEAANIWITVSLTEGKNREVRRVLEHLGLKVNRLIRLAYGPFALGTLPTGAAEEIGPRVIREQLAGLIAPANLPTGDRRPAPMALGPARRNPTEKGAPKAAPATPGARPAHKSRANPRSHKQPEPEKKVYKAGWAKPKPKARITPKPPKPRGKPKAK
jgi:23S rRNA pseudouridine2605 synthase